MTADNGSPRWRYEHQALMQQLRSDHESAYREFRDFKASVGRQLDNIDQELRLVLPIPRQVEELTKALDRLSEKLESAVLTQGQGRRADWTMALMVLGFVAMVVFNLVKAGAH